MPPRVADNLLVATWNLRAFGSLTRKWHSGPNDTPRRDLESALCIAEVVSRFDVIAIQEVKADLRALRDLLKKLGSNWSFALTDVTYGSPGNGERLAYLFDTTRVRCRAWPASSSSRTISTRRSRRRPTPSSGNSCARLMR